MKVLILNRLQLKQAPYHEWFAECQAELHLLSSRTALGTLDGEPARMLEHYAEAHFYDEFDTNGLVDLHALELARRVGIEHVVAISEFDLVRAGVLRRALGLPGQDTDAALAFRDKALMKEFVPNPIAVWRHARSFAELVAVVAELGYPAVLKPRSGAGSINTRVFREPGDLASFLRDTRAPNGGLDLLVEQWVEGEMYHVDGLAIEGRIVSAWASRYVNTCLSYQEGLPHASLTLSRDNPLVPRLLEANRAALSRLPTRGAFGFHAEFFHTPTNELVFCEVAARVGGGCINSTYLGTMGIDLNRAMALAQAGIQPTGELRTAPGAMLHGDLLLPTRAGILISAPRVCPFAWVTEYAMTGTLGGKYGAPGSSVERVAEAVFKGESEAELVARSAELIEWWRVSSRWAEEPMKKA